VPVSPDDERTIVSRLFELDDDECLQLLGAGVFGRIAFCTPRGPEMMPINYTTVDGEILMRTSAESHAAHYVDGAPLLFETDYVNYERWYGWSVIARGIGESVDEEHLTTAERSVPEPQPWARRGEPLWVRLRWTELTGRRIGTGWKPDAELPVRRMPWHRTRDEV
jgi:hypothetical protein